ncbi:MAG: hypothetical protein AAF943_15770 [Pseudomonadota bacterium]
MSLCIGVGVGATLSRALLDSVPQIITATVTPVLSALSAADTPADGLPASATSIGNYSSTEGSIVSAVASFTVDGQSQPGTYDLVGGEVVTATILVTDNQGNPRSFSAGTVTVPLPLPTFTVQPTIGSGVIGDTITLTEGIAGPGAIITIEEFTLGGIDKTGELSGLDWDTTGEAAGEIRLQVRATNSSGFTLSNVITRNLTEPAATIPTTLATLIDQGNGDSLTLSTALPTFQWADGSWGAVSDAAAVLTADAPAVTTDANGHEMHGLMLREDINISDDFTKLANGWDELNSVSADVRNDTYVQPYDAALNKAPSKTSTNLQVAVSGGTGAVTKVVRTVTLPTEGADIDNTSILERINVFTVVPSAPAVGSIRPPQFGGTESLLNLSDADFSRARSFTLPSGVMPALSTVLEYVQSPQLCNLFEGESRRGLCVSVDYARDIIKTRLAPAALYMLHSSTSQADRDALLAAFMMKATDAMSAFNAGVVQGGGAGQHIADQFCVALIGALCPGKTAFATAAEAMRSNISDQAFFGEAIGVGHAVDYQTRATATASLQNHQPLLPEHVGWPQWHADSRSLEPWYTTGQNSSTGARYRTIALGMSMDAFAVLGLIEGGWDLAMGPQSTWNSSNDRFAQLGTLDVHRDIYPGALAPVDSNAPSLSTLAIWDENRATFPEGGTLQPIVEMPPIQMNFDLVSTGFLTATATGLDYDYAGPDDLDVEWRGSTTAITGREARLGHDGIQFAAPVAINASGSLAFTGARYVQERRSNLLGTSPWSPNYPRLNGLDQPDRNVVTGGAIPTGAPVNTETPKLYKHRYDEASGFPLYDEITSTIEEGTTLITAGAGLYQDGVDSLSYQHQRRSNGGSWTNISGATDRILTRAVDMLSSASNLVEVSCLVRTDDGQGNETTTRSEIRAMPVPQTITDDFSTDPGDIAVVTGTTEVGSAVWVSGDGVIRVTPDDSTSFPIAYIPLDDLIVGLDYTFLVDVSAKAGSGQLGGVISSTEDENGSNVDGASNTRISGPGTIQIEATALASTMYFGVQWRGGVPTGASFDVTLVSATPVVVTPVLSAATTPVATGTTTATMQITTDTSGIDIAWTANPTGAGSAVNGTHTVSATGAQNISITGLAEDTEYTVDLVQGASNVVTTAAFTTDAPAPSSLHSYDAATDTSTTGWTASGGTLVHDAVADEIRLEHSGSAFPYMASPALAVTIGNTYEVTVTYRGENNSDHDLMLGTNANDNDAYGFYRVKMTGTITHTMPQFTATTENLFIGLKKRGGTSNLLSHAILSFTVDEVT